MTRLTHRLASAARTTASALGAGLLMGLSLMGMSMPVAQAQSASAPMTSPAIAEQAITAMPLAPGERIMLDGSLDHPAWQRAPVHSRFIEHGPDNGRPARQRTEVQVLFDDQALYVGVRALDTDPSQIRAPLVRHDQVKRTQDFVVVYIDAVGLKQSAQFFRVNAAGSTADGMHTAADDNEDFSPDFDFDAAARRDERGYTAVFRLPFASLRFAADDASAWRIMVGRRMPREQYTLDTSVHLPRGSPHFIAALQPLQGVALPAHAQFLTLRPSLTWRRQQQQPAGGASQRSSTVDASLDIKWRPLPELVVDGTLNPDFSQVALDVPQLSGNTRFALEQAEKRPFFFESSDLLRTPTQALYTRSFTEPRAGLRGTWRGARLAGTAWAIDDRGGGIVLVPGAFGTGVVQQQPGSQALVARVLSTQPGLQWGGLVVSRRYEDDRGDNQVAGPDLAWQINPDWRLRGQWLQSSTSAQADAQGLSLERGARNTGHRGVLKLNYQTANLEADATVDDRSAGFRHDTGFVNQVGVQRLAGRLGRGWQGLAPFNDVWLNLEGEQVRDKASGLTVSRDLYPNLWVTGPRNAEAWLQWHGHSVLRTATSQPLLAQRYWLAGFILSPARWLPLMDAELRWGRLADVGSNSLKPGAQGHINLSLRPLGWLELEARLDRAWLRADGQRSYDESASSLLAVAHIDARQTLRLIVQGHRSEFQLPGARQTDTGTTGSLTYGWRQSAGSALYVGLARDRQRAGAGVDPSRVNEAFIKLQVDVDEVRRRF